MLFSSSSKSSRIREDAIGEIVSMASQVSISSVKVVKCLSRINDVVLLTSASSFKIAPAKFRDVHSYRFCQHSSYRAPTPIPPSSPIASCRTPRRRLLLHSADNSPQISPVDAVSSSPADIQRVASKLIFSPDTSQKSLEITLGVQKIQLNQTGGRCFLFSRSSSWEDEGKSAANMSMLPSPIELDDDVRKTDTHCRERIIINR